MVPSVFRQPTRADPPAGWTVIAQVALAGCIPEPEAMDLSEAPERRAREMVHKKMHSVADELRKHDHPRFFWPIPLGEAPSEWPRWSSKQPPPPNVLGHAIAKIDELEAGQIAVAEPEDIPWDARQVVGRYDMLFTTRLQPRLDIDLRFRSVRDRTAHLMTSTWSPYPAFWFLEVAGTIGDAGVSLLFHRRRGYGQGFGE